MSLCDDCIKGVRHEGTPEGKYEKVAGVDCYIATPTGDYAKDKVVLYLPDAFGIQFSNAQLLADDFARNGFKVIMIDYFDNDPCPPGTMGGFAPGFSLQEWIVGHGSEQVRKPLNAVIAALQADGVSRFGATGYCFGGRYVFDLAFENVIHVAVTAHPSLLKSPDDFEKYLNTAKAPLLLNSCTTDGQFPPSAQAQADQILGGGKFAPGYMREYFDGCSHGFAVRGDLSDPKVKAGKEGAFEKSVAFFKKYL